MKPNSFFKISLAGCVVILVLSLAYSVNLWNIRGVHGSDEYTKYRGTGGICAAFVEGHLWGDSIRADMTLLEATDTAGWALLCNDFGLQTHHDTADSSHLEEGKDILEVFLAPDDGDIVVASHRDSYICLFHSDDSVQRMKLFNAIYDKVFYAVTYKQNFFDNEKNN